MASLYAHPVSGDFVAPLITEWSLFLHPVNLGWLVTFFSHNNFMKVTVCWFWA